MPQPSRIPIPGFARFLHDRFERNTMSVLAGQRSQRAENIAQTPSTVLRSLDNAMLNSVSRNPAGAARLLGRAVPAGLTVIGAGSTHTVVFASGQVLKIYRPSVFMERPEQESAAREFNRLHAILCKYLGQCVVPQITSVIEHPLAPGQTAVVSVQRRVDFRRIDVFRAHEATIDVAALRSATTRYEGLADELKAMASQAMRMQKETGLLVDCSGMDNLVVTAAEPSGLVCLDGLPIATGSIGDTNRIRGQLRALVKALDAKDF